MIVPSKPWVCTVDIFKISIKSCCQVVNYDKTSWSSSTLAIRPDRCHHHGLRLCQTPGASLGDKKVELKLSLGVLAWFNRGKLLERYVWQDTAWAALSLSSDLGQHQMKKNYPFREKIRPPCHLLVMWSPGHTALSASTNSKRATVLDWEWTKSSPRHLSDPGGSHVLSRSIRTDSCWHLARRRWLTLARLRSRMVFLALVSL